MSTLFRRSAQLIVFALVLVSVGGLTLAQSTESFGWQRYRAEGFSVLLPEHPNTMLIVAPKRMNERRPPARLFTAYKDQVAYIVLVFDNPSPTIRFRGLLPNTSDYNLNAKQRNLREIFRAQDLAVKSTPSKIKTSFVESSASISHLIVFMFCKQLARTSINRKSISFWIPSRSGVTTAAIYPTTIHRNRNRRQLAHQLHRKSSGQQSHDQSSMF